MQYSIRELRDATGLTQKAFAQHFRIPLSTLRKWEQGEASPPPYVLDLLAFALPSANRSLLKIQGNNGTLYYYDKAGKRVLDMLGNAVAVEEELEGVKEQNLVLYLEDLFEGFYAIQAKFNRDLHYDKIEGILWTR